MKIAIYGSCVSRDIFNYSDEFDVIDYQARSSIISQTSLSAEHMGIDVSRNKSSFQRKMIEGDINKNYLDNILKKDFNVMLIDFIDERLPVVLAPSGSAITQSPELTSTGFNPENITGSKRIFWLDENYINYWNSAIKIFSEKLKGLGLTEKIILNQVYYAKYSKNGKIFPESWIIRSNLVLDMMYKTFIDLLPEVSRIQYPSNSFVAGRCCINAH